MQHGRFKEVFIDRERDVVFCPECELGAFRRSLFQRFGFRLVVTCQCGAKVHTGLQLDDLPRLEFDEEAIGAMSDDELEAAIFYGTLPVVFVEKYPGVEVTSDTPLWALFGTQHRRLRRAA